MKLKKKQKQIFRVQQFPDLSPLCNMNFCFIKILIHVKEEKLAIHWVKAYFRLWNFQQTRNYNTKYNPSHQCKGRGPKLRKKNTLEGIYSFLFLEVPQIIFSMTNFSRVIRLYVNNYCSMFNKTVRDFLQNTDKSIQLGVTSDFLESGNLGSHVIHINFKQM